MERGTPSPPLALVGGVEVTKMGDGKMAAGGAAGAKNETSRETGNSARITTSTAMTSPSAGTGSSVSYLHSSSSRNPSTSTIRSNILGIMGVTAGAARRNSIMAPAREDANCVIKEGVFLVGPRAGGNHEAPLREVT